MTVYQAYRWLTAGTPTQQQAAVTAMQTGDIQGGGGGFLGSVSSGLGSVIATPAVQVAAPIAGAIAGRLLAQQGVPVAAIAGSYDAAMAGHPPVIPGGPVSTVAPSSSFADFFAKLFAFAFPRRS